MKHGFGRQWAFALVVVAMALGGLGPLWAIHDADRIAAVAALPLAERYAKCPWALYHIGVEAG